MNNITPEILRELIDYDPKSGLMWWKKRTLNHIPQQRALDSWNTKWAGKPALVTSAPGGYLKGSIFHKDIKAHRAAWAIHYGKWPSNQIDHINRNPRDNRISNLRDVTPQQNCANRNPQTSRGAIPSGIDFCKGRWRVRTRIDGRRIYVGSFQTIEEAIANIPLRKG